MRILVLLAPELRELPFTGTTLGEHVLGLAVSAGLQGDLVAGSADVGGADLVLDGRYVGLRPETLATLASLGDDHALVTGFGAVVARRVAPGPRRTVRAVLDAPLSSLPERAHPVPTPEAMRPADAWELGQAERALTHRRLESLGRAGVRIVDPSRVVLEGSVTVEPGAVLWPGVVLRGTTRVGAGAEIQTGVVLDDTVVEAGAVVKPYSVCEGAHIGPGASVGPMAHLRTGAVLEAGVKIGNYVEVKKTVLREGAKASHLTYLGDAEIGAGANVGAGTITCNYDGFGKHRTEIGAGAFIGSNTALVAPITVGAGAIVGAGSTLSRSVPDDALAVERAEQRVLEGKARMIHERNRRRAGK